MAGDKRFTDAMKAATTHVGTGGNPKIGVPVGFIRPSPHHSFFPPDSPNACLICLPSLSQALGTKSCLPPPYDDTSARAETALLTRLESEGYKAPLVREVARASPVCPDLLALSDPLVTLSGVSSSRFAHPNAFASLASSLDSDDEDDVSDSSLPRQ
jgi:hypothetical protein